MTHHHLAFELLCCIKSNTNYDKEGCTTHLNCCTCKVTNKNWKDSNYRKEKSADKCYFAEDSGNEVLCVFTWAEAWDNTVVFTQVVCDFNWVVLN